MAERACPLPLQENRLDPEKPHSQLRHTSLQHQGVPVLISTAITKHPCIRNIRAVSSQTHQPEETHGNGKHKSTQETGTPCSHENGNARYFGHPGNIQAAHLDLTSLRKNRDKMTSCRHPYMSKPFQSNWQANIWSQHNFCLDVEGTAMKRSEAAHALLTAKAGWTSLITLASSGHFASQITASSLLKLLRA